MYYLIRNIGTIVFLIREKIHLSKFFSNIFFKKVKKGTEIAIFKNYFQNTEKLLQLDINFR